MDFKMFLIVLLIISQIAIYAFAFINPNMFIACIVVSFILFIILMVALIRERLKEKKEDENNDYRNY